MAQLRPWGSVPVLLLALACGDGSAPETPASEAGAPAPAPAAAAGQVDGERIAQADLEPGSWLAHGRDYLEQRFSSLQAIDKTNVSQLGLAWSYDLDSTRGVEATPLVVDGVMYVSAPWGKVHAVDARTGEGIWSYDPQVPGDWARHACCDVVNRGVAVWKGAVYVGTIDGRLVSLDAATGKPSWEVQTTPKDRGYTITGAPRVVKDKVIIGNGGAELGVRGFITAYDAATGRQAWRFYTVPGDPSKPFEHPELEKAAGTWTGEWWDVGGGGTAWDAMAYDPERELLYVGTGNGSPWTRYARSPGGGDNLYLCSILALNPDTGELVWHYQTTPGDNWDYTSTQHIMLADLEIDGTRRAVLLHAPKNGFFYVLDRTTGELISAEPFAAMNWATHVDPKTGRPVETELANYSKQARKIFPGPQGAHSWHPMAFHAGTGLVYIPAQDLEFWYTSDPTMKYRFGEWSLGIDTDETVARAEDQAPKMTGHLLAWDPLAQREVWRVPHESYWNGGVLATAGGLVFQGTGDGKFAAYDAANGELLWDVQAQTGIMAGPISYAIDGVQYVAVAAGWGGGVIATGFVEGAVINDFHNEGRVLVFKLGGARPLPSNQRRDRRVPVPPALTVSAEQVAEGKHLYNRYCMPCHGFGAASSWVTPDLRYLSPERHGAFEQIVLQGILSGNGMPRFADFLTSEDLPALHGYLIAEAQAAYAEQLESTE